MNPNPQKSPNAENEEKLLAFWRDNNIFEKTLSDMLPNGEKRKNLVFYDGPPFATGLPHYGHILGGTGKDVFARYQTMRGFRVPRKWGWDTHGLPIETIVEKSLGIKSKKEIEEMGLETFSREAKSKVLGFVADWEKTVERTARWVDFKGSYKTMDLTFMESVWWALGQLNDKGLIYEADRILPYCPRCQTPLANAEIAMDNSYKDIVDISVYVKMRIRDRENEYLLAWTTTPWTLPGNTALAVNPELDYVKVSFENNFYYVGKNRFEFVFKDKDAQVVAELKGTDLVGFGYVPLFDYFVHGEVAQSETIWKIYAADFVTADTGTGIVHIAPSFGEDDAVLAKKYSIPAIKHVALDGTFVSEVTHFAGAHVKPKGDHQATDVEIIKYLAHNHLLFAKEKITHSYPHCYRCETPLLYYGLSSWFIRVQDYKKRMLELNEGIDWVPDHLKNGRFQHVLENAPDWNFSRNRFWATPLPIWKSASGKMKFISSIGELQKYSQGSITKIIFVRHGEAENNILGISSCDREKYPLTDLGKSEANEVANRLGDQKIDIIFSSPILRARETAQPLSEKTGLQVIIDDRLAEINNGEWNNKRFDDPTVYEDRMKYRQLAPEDRYVAKRGGVESWQDVEDRVASFIHEIIEKYPGKTIVCFAHQGSNSTAIKHIKNIAVENVFNEVFRNPEYTNNGAVVPMYIDTKRKLELDLHRPYIDAIKLEIDGEEYVRIPEVIDCWFESGSMPFAQNHYPFEKPDWQETNFPADFVVEYIAQTRTWFYYTLLISTILFDRAPFKHVVTTGNLNGDDGQKMSKSKGNYPDPWIIMDKYGADVLRMYLMSSPLMKGEDANFDEKAVDELNKKLFNLLRNVVSFYEMYKTDEDLSGDKYNPYGACTNVLDRWILAKFDELSKTVGTGLDAYQPLEPARAIRDFIGELSTWYIRRSRDRFKGADDQDRKMALNTTALILRNLSITMAPFTPFVAEEVFQKVKHAGDPESVHLGHWIDRRTSDYDFGTVIADMEQVRTLVTLGLEARAKANIKVRQPLAKLSVFKIELSEEYLDIVKDELNVKEIVADDSLNEGEVVLDTEITEDLQNEGDMRELVRKIQDMRKTANLEPRDRVNVHLSGLEPAWFVKFQNEVLQSVGADKVVWGGEEGIQKI